MAQSIQVSILCASGRVAVFADTNISENTTTTLQTGGVGLNQTSGIDLGNFLVGETITHAFGTCTAATTASATSTFLFGFVENPDGSIAVPIEGGGSVSGCMPALCRPIRVTVGMLLKVANSLADATNVQASLVAYCASGKTSVFTVTAVADTKTAIVDITTGGSIGQSLAGQRVVKYYATFSNSNGVNDDQGGNNFYYVESSQGQLKATMFPKLPSLYAKVEMVPCNIPIMQNDTLSVMWGS